MAENLSGLELVPRGIEGTGKAVVLGNEPVVQSLARLSGRLDNLAKLKLYAQGKKAEAKEKKIEYNSAPYKVEGIESGYMTPLVQSIVNPMATSLEKNFLNLNRDQQNVQIGIFGRTLGSSNNFIKKTESDVAAESKALSELGWDVKPEALEIGRNLYANQMVAKGKEAAQAAGITDPAEVQGITTQLLLGNPNVAVNTFRQAVTSNPNNINLNNFGARIIKTIDETGVDVRQADGTFKNVNRSNVRNADGSLNYDLIKLATGANPMDERMLTLASSQYLQGAAKATGDPKAVEAVETYVNKNFNDKDLTTDQLSLITQKVLPKAQEAVIERMFAGKGKFQYERSFETNEDVERAKAAAYEKQGIKTLRTNPVYTNTIGTVIPGKGGFVAQTQKGKQSTVAIKAVNLGEATTKTLAGDDKFKINTGSRVWFFGYAPQSLKNLLASSFADGSASLKIPIQTSNLTVLDNIPYATVGNPEFKAESGQKFILPKGTIVNPNTYNSQPIANGGQYAVVDIEEAIKFLPEKTREKIEAELAKYDEQMQGFRIIVGMRDNPQTKTKFIGTVQPVSNQKNSGSVNFLK
jgi:hypothetical protein